MRTMRRTDLQQRSEAKHSGKQSDYVNKPSHEFILQVVAGGSPTALEGETFQAWNQETLF